MLKTFKLKNGIKVAAYSIPEMKSILITSSSKGGVFFETPKNSGVAHFMEHLLVEGIPSLPNVEIFTDFIESLAGSHNADTSRQVVRFTLNGPESHLNDLLMITSEVFFAPLFAEDAVERERRAISQEIRQVQDSVWYKNWQFWSSFRFKQGHPMQYRIAGTLESVAKIKRADLVNFWSDFFYPKNCFLVIVGGFKIDNLSLLLNEYFGKYTSGKTFPGFPKFTNKDLSDWQVAIRYDKDLKNCYVDLSFPSISDEYSLKERITGGVVRSILGGLHRSRLYRLLRQRKGLVYDVGFSSTSYPQFGYAEISCQTDVGNLEEVAGLIVKELSSFVKNGPTDEEVEFAKNYRINRALMSFDHPSNIASWIEDNLLWEEKIYLPEEYVKIIEDVSIKDIKDFVEKFWDLDKLNLTIQGPIEDTESNIKKFSAMLKDLKNG